MQTAKLKAHLRKEVAKIDKEEFKYAIILNYYQCPVCKKWSGKPLGEIKPRPIRRCRNCGNVVKMILEEKSNGKKEKMQIHGRGAGNP